MLLRARLCSLLRLPPPRRPFAGVLPSGGRSISCSADPPPYFSVRIKCPNNVSDLLSESLLCFGAASASIDEIDSGEATDVIWINSVFTGEQDVGSCILLAAESIGLKDVLHYEVYHGEDCDWVKLSQETFRPVNVMDELWVIPAWRTHPNIDAKNIILDPGSAFGTGEHPTTKLCLLLLHELIKGGESFLDYGTGSGILCIAALKLGAATSVGIDIDPQAITAAHQNAALNDIQPDKMQLHLSRGDDANLSPYRTMYDTTEELNSNGGGLDHEKGKHDVVIANILLNPLVKLADEIASYAKPGGVIALSGILCDQVPQIEQCYSKYVDFLSIKEMDGWACIRGKRKDLS